MPTLLEQLTEAKAELALRQRVFPKWVNEGRKSKAQADMQITRMQAIVHTLDKLYQLEQVSKEMLTTTEQNQSQNQI